MKTSDVLRKAGDVLRERGWCQRQFSNENGNVCAYGAVRVVVGPDAWIPFTRELDAIVETPGLRMPFWNDVPGRTPAEVMHALDAAYVLALQLEGEDLDEYEAL